MAEKTFAASRYLESSKKSSPPVSILAKTAADLTKKDKWTRKQGKKAVDDQGILEAEGRITSSHIENFSRRWPFKVNKTLQFLRLPAEIRNMVYEEIVAESNQQYDGTNGATIIGASETMNSLMTVSKQIREEVSSMLGKLQGLIIMEDGSITILSKEFKRHKFCRYDFSGPQEFSFEAFDSHSAHRKFRAFPLWTTLIKSWMVNFRTCKIRFCLNFVDRHSPSWRMCWQVNPELKCTMRWVMAELSKFKVQNMHVQFSCNCGPDGTPGVHDYWKNHRFREHNLASFVLYQAARSRLPGRLKIDGSEHLPHYVLALDCYPADERSYRHAIEECTRQYHR